MSNGPIPLYVEPYKLADRGISFSDELPLERFARVAQALTGTAGVVQASIAFSRDEQRHLLMELHLSARVSMQCQRCLEEVGVLVGGDYSYIIVAPGRGSDQFSRDYDVLELDDEPLDVLALIEDELLLGLPIVPMHPQGECKHPDGYQEPAQDAGEEVQSSPFSVLAQLKRDAKL